MPTDFKRSLDSYRARTDEFRVLDVPAMQYLMVDGQGDPNSSPQFANAITSLYPVAYKLKFASKNELGLDYVVPPLEGLWFSHDSTVFTSARDKSCWSWTLMLMVPHWITEESFDTAVTKAATSERVRLEALSEGTCVQTLHLGSFDDEAQILARMHDEFIPEQGLRMVGKHHEIYFSDFRKVKPSKLRTILRQPVTTTLPTPPCPPQPAP